MKSRILVSIIVVLSAVWLILGVRAPSTPDRYVVADSQQYMRMATQFLQTGSFGLSDNPNADLIRSPGYPLFLALVHLALGDYRWASLIQILLALANCILIFRITAELGCEKRVGYAGIILYLATPNAAFYPLMIMTEGLTSFLLILSLWSFVRYLVVRRAGWLVLSGVVMSLAAFVRPAIVPLLIIWCVLLVALIAYTDKTKFWRPAVLRPLLVFLISGFALILGWQVRNYLTHGRFAFATVGGATLKYWIAGQGIAEIKGITRQQAEYLINTSPDPNGFIVQTIRQNIGPYLKFTARGLVRTAIATDYRSWAYDLTGAQIQESGLVSSLKFDIMDLLSRFGGGNGWILLGLYATLLSLLSLVLIALVTWRAIRHRRASPVVFALVVMALVTILYITLTPLGHGSARFREPVEPYIALLAGLAFHKFAAPAPAESVQNA